MRKTGLALILATALAACGTNDTSTSKTDGAFLDRAERRSALQSKAVAPAPAPPPMVGAAAGNVGGVEDMAASRLARQQASDAEGATRIDAVQTFTTASTSTMLIRTGQAFIEVQKLDPAILKIRQLVAQVGGYITNSSMSGGKDQIRQASIEIKIPNSQYDKAVGSLSEIGKVETVGSNAQDVGEEFVDVTARVANAHRLEERLIDLLTRRTGKLDEVLRVERELARVREEIERYEGRLRYLTARVAMSTLTLNVHEPAPLIEPGSNPIADAFRRAWQNFVSLLAALIAATGVLVPLGLVGIAGWIGYRRWVKAHRPVTA
ncbi:MAG TPA: DUF4349 domain-containing protein [Gemmatimonadaceae bacterium]|nr:DUF4349 domain-containing protein [Gemmatimonadaceae bacterium]